MYGAMYGSIIVIIILILNMIFLFQKASRKGNKKTMNVLVGTTLILLVILSFVFKRL